MKKLIVLIFLLCMFVVNALGETVYILCQPDSFVNVRMFPKKGAEVVGYIELGDSIESDLERKNGFIHVFGFDYGEGWINAGFVTEYPVTVEKVKTTISSKGRVACRRSIKGTRRKWLTDGTEVVIYGFADDWSITNKGFIQTAYLEGF